MRTPQQHDWEALMNTKGEPRMTRTMARKLDQIRAAGQDGLIVRDILASLENLRRMGLITIEQHEPITRHGGPGWNYLIKAVAKA